MGIWGTGILQDDFALDVYDRYVDATGRGAVPHLIIEELRQTHASALMSADVDAVFWLALAHAQRDAASLDPDVYRRVTEIVEQGVGLEPWAEAGGGVLGRRRSVLTRFLRSLVPSMAQGAAAPQPAPPAALVPDFELGDCLSVQLPDGRYAGVVVTRKNDHPTAPSLIVSVTNVAGPTAPDAQDFSPVQWQLATHAESPGKVVEYQVFAEGLARSRRHYQVVCRTEIDRAPEPSVVRLANWGTLWKKLPDALMPAA